VSKRYVFKVGTTTLVHKTGRLNLRAMEDLVMVLSDLKNAGNQVVLVSSGAIGAGVGRLGLDARPKDVAGKQACATVGQCELMFMYDKLFAQYGHTVGQLLITREDVEDPIRGKNLRSAFDRLFEYDAIPIVNENDAVAVEEIVYGDNDNLSAVVAVMIAADDLILLTETDALYTADPHKDPSARRIAVVETIDDDLRAVAQGAGSELGTGGMITKVHAAEVATAAGIDTFIMDGHSPRKIYELLSGEDVGTHFKAVKSC